MPRVKQVKAAKDYPKFGIKKGDVHYHWKIKTGPVSGIEYRQLTPPTPQQLTTSEFKIGVLNIEDEIAKLSEIENVEDFESAVDDIKGSITELKEETEGKRDNLPENFQESSPLNEQIEQLESWESDFDRLDYSYEEADDDEALEALQDEDDSESDDDPTFSDEQIAEKKESMNTERQKEKCDELRSEIEGFSTPG